MSAGHFRSHALPLAQPTLQDPVQTTWQVAEVHPMLLLEPTVKLQVAPDVQLRLALLPAVTVHVLPPLHGPLQEFPQVPLQVPLVHASEQLATDGSHPIWLNELPPHATRAAVPSAARSVFTTGPFDSLPDCDIACSHPATEEAGTEERQVCSASNRGAL